MRQLLTSMLFVFALDPTRAKCLLVHAWLRTTLGRLSILNPEMQKSVFKRCQDLQTARDGIDKVDNVVLPLPYCQPLKAFNLIWVYTLPFVIVAEVGTMLPLVMALIACALVSIRWAPSSKRRSCGTRTTIHCLIGASKSPKT